MAGGVEEFAATAPKLEGEVIKGIVAVGEGGEDGAVKVVGGVGEETRGLLKLLPCDGWSEVATELRAKIRAAGRIGEDIAAIDEAFGAVMPG